MPVNVLIADESCVVRQGLQTFLATAPELQLVATVAGAREAIEFTRELKPDVVLLDLFMQEANGFEVIRTIRQENPTVAILVLTGNWKPQQVGLALQAGANGFLLKSMEADALCHAILSASLEYVTLAPQVAETLVQTFSASTASGCRTATFKMLKTNEESLVEKLSGREQEILQMMADGKTNKEIAYLLNLSEKTIKVHVSILLSKLGTQNRTQAALKAAQYKLIQLK